MANIGYIQVVRHCNHFCGFCSNPTTPYTHDLDSMRVLVDDFADRGYFGVILTGGEPTLHPELPAVAAYARDRGLHVRMITNGSRLSDPAFARAMADSGLSLVHVSVYSVRPEVEAQLRGVEGTLEKSLAAITNAHACGIDVNINCVINRQNADHLDENVRYWIKHHPYIRHFVWNNLDPSMGRAEVNQDVYTHRLADCELSLSRAMRLLHRSGRTFRVEKMPLCYMTEFGWASTETRKIVKGEERIVHFLDEKQTVRQTEWGHVYAPCCDACSLRSICGGLFGRGDAYDPEELYPVFVDRDALVEAILSDGTDPSHARVTVDEWKKTFAGPPRASADSEPIPMDTGLLPVGKLTDKGRRLYEAKRRAESKKANALGVRQEGD